MTTRRWVSGAFKAAGLMLILVGLSNAVSAGTGPIGRNPCPRVPEIDPGSVLTALTMLAGGLMVVTDRRRAN